MIVTEKDKLKRKLWYRFWVYLVCMCLTFNIIVDVFGRSRRVVHAAGEEAAFTALYWLLSTLAYECFSAMGFEIDTGIDLPLVDDTNINLMLGYFDTSFEKMNEMIESGDMVIDTKYKECIKVLGNYKSYTSENEFLRDFLAAYPDDAAWVSGNSTFTLDKTKADYQTYTNIHNKKGIVINNTMKKALTDVIYEGFNALAQSTSVCGTDIYIDIPDSSNSSLRYVVNYYLNNFKFSDVPGLSDYLESYDKYILINDYYSRNTYQNKNIDPDQMDLTWYGYFTNDSITAGYNKIFGTYRPSIKIENAVKVKISAQGVEVIDESYSSTITRITIRNYKNITIGGLSNWKDSDGNPAKSLPSSYEYGVDHAGTIPSTDDVNVNSIFDAEGIAVPKGQILEAITKPTYWNDEESFPVTVGSVSAVLEGIKALDIEEEDKIIDLPSAIDESATDTSTKVKEDADAQTKEDVDSKLDDTSYNVADFTTSGLINKFPFCIPADLINAVKMLAAPAEAPYIEIPIKLERLGIDEAIVIDFAPFETVASVFRVVETFGFIILLISLTRDKIKG